jgi:Flp pilus assembly protein TadG
MRWVIAKYRSVHARIEAVAHRLRADERGVTFVLTAMSAAVLIGFVGLATDVVMWEVQQRDMQGAADQAALAGATAYADAGETVALGDSTTAQNAAQAIAYKSGFVSPATVTAVKYNNGTTCTSDACLQVTITQNQQRYFTALFSTSAVPVSASAVSIITVSANKGGDACVMALDASGSGVITDSGTATMSLNNCNLYNNSPNTSATVLNGGGTIEGCTAANACGSKAFLAQPDDPSGNIDVPVVTNATPAPDPYAGLAPPSTSLCSGAPSFPSGGHSSPVTVNPGTYASGPSKDQYTFNPGVYVFCTGWTDQTATITGAGVFIYVPTGGGKINGNSTVNISSPTAATCASIPATCPYIGMALWIGDNSGFDWNGGNTTAWSGAIYAPTSVMTYEGNNASTSTCTRLIAAAIKLAGTPVATFNNAGCPAVAGPVLAASGQSGSPKLIQ